MIESLAFFMINYNQSLVALFCMNTVKQLIHFLSVTFDSLDAVCKELSHGCILKNSSTVPPLLVFTTAKPLIIYIPQTRERPWGTLSLSLSPPHIFILKALTLELVHTAMIDS